MYFLALPSGDGRKNSIGTIISSIMRCYILCLTSDSEFHVALFDTRGALVAR